MASPPIDRTCWKDGVAETTWIESTCEILVATGGRREQGPNSARCWTKLLLPGRSRELFPYGGFEDLDGSEIQSCFAVVGSPGDFRCWQRF